MLWNMTYALLCVKSDKKSMSSFLAKTDEMTHVETNANYFKKWHLKSTQNSIFFMNFLIKMSAYLKAYMLSNVLFLRAHMLSNVLFLEAHMLSNVLFLRAHMLSKMLFVLLPRDYRNMSRVKRLTVILELHIWKHMCFQKEHIWKHMCSQKEHIWKHICFQICTHFY